MFEIVKATHNITVLEFMARELGYTLMPREAVNASKRQAVSKERSGETTM